MREEVRYTTVRYGLWHGGFGGGLCSRSLESYWHLHMHGALLGWHVKKEACVAVTITFGRPRGGVVGFCATVHKGAFQVTRALYYGLRVELLYHVYEQALIPNT